MTVAENKFDELSGLYLELIRKTLQLHNVEEVRCENEKEHFFDVIIMDDDGKMHVYNHGFGKPSERLYFDFTTDYATCLCYIEHDIFLAQRKGKPEKGMVITFNREERRSGNTAV